MSKQLGLDPKSTALVLIDLQNGIVGMNTAPYPAADVVKKCKDLAAQFHANDGLVVYVHVNLSDMVQIRVDKPRRDSSTPPPPPEASEFVAGLDIRSSDLKIMKRHWSAFLKTELEAKLKTHGIKTIALGGIATNFGVESTARDAAGLGFNVVIIEDAMTSISKEAHQFSIDTVFPGIAQIRKSTELEIARR